ncbi:hypothetical protein N7470_001669 [Penicillium chermesinum]|nr:hypothetical protein N7470_001669 [Penicillium chermesinum]
MSINPTAFLPWIKKELEAKGVVFIRKTLTSIDEAKGITRAQIIVHASGLGAFQLANDKAVEAVRGQTMLVDTDFDELQMNQGSHFTYVIPRMFTQGAIIGGVSQPGAQGREVDVRLRSDILNRVRKLTKGKLDQVSLEKDLQRDIVAFRPGRRRDIALKWKETRCMHMDSVVWAIPSVMESRASSIAMFARSCARLATSRTAVPLSSYLSRVRPYSTGSYEHILTSTPKPGPAPTSKKWPPLSFAAAYNDNFIAPWSHLANTIRKPVIAAVAGHALGGGCELALMCDILYCTANANFGQPEIKLGTIPGGGGSQRLTRLIGKSKAMELILTGKNFSGKDAGEWGVAAQVVDGGKDEVLEVALKTAETIAGYSRVATVAAKEVVNKSQELSLKEGVDYERRLFHALFGSKDQTIGMTAFAEKKKPEWSNE